MEHHQGDGTTSRIRTGAEIFIDTLVEQEAKYIFCHTGGRVILPHVELSKRYKQGINAPIRIMFRQEGGAGHAAEGYAQISGRPGVVMVTSGPGATNLVTAITDAYKDSVPVVFVTGQVTSDMIGTDAFQEAPITSMTEQVTKHNYIVKSAHDIGWILRQALYIATTGRPGPVLVDICSNAFAEKSQNGYEEMPLRGYNPIVELDKGKAGKILEELLKAERPVIKAGGGVISSDSGKLLYAFAKKYRIPVTLTLKGLGAIPHNDKLFLGMPGMHGTGYANNALEEADFILTIGGRFDDRVAVKGFGEGKTIAHVDIEATELNKVIQATYGLQADAKDFLSYAISHFEHKGRNDISKWHSRIRELRDRYPLSYSKDKHIINPQFAVEMISELTGGKAIITTGVGQHQMWTAQYYNFQYGRQLATSGGLGTMGYGLPAAIGAYFANPDVPVICIDGDGSFQMNMQELGTVMQNQLPIKIVIMNNEHLGMVRDWEDNFFGAYHEECDLKNPDFLRLAGAYGIKTMRLTKPSYLKSGLEKVLKEKGPCVVDVWVNPIEDVWPMIPSGKGIKDAIYR